MSMVFHTFFNNFQFCLQSFYIIYELFSYGISKTSSYGILYHKWLQKYKISIIVSNSRSDIPDSVKNHIVERRKESKKEVR